MFQRSKGNCPVMENKRFRPFREASVAQIDRTFQIHRIKISMQNDRSQCSERFRMSGNKQKK